MPVYGDHGRVLLSHCFTNGYVNGSREERLVERGFRFVSTLDVAS